MNTNSINNSYYHNNSNDEYNNSSSEMDFKKLDWDSFKTKFKEIKNSNDCPCYEKFDGEKINNIIAIKILQDNHCLFRPSIKTKGAIIFSTKKGGNVTEYGCFFYSKKGDEGLYSQNIKGGEISKDTYVSCKIYKSIQKQANFNELKDKLS